MTDLSEVWIKALEAKPDAQGRLVILTYATRDAAFWARNEFYKVRSRWRRQSRHNLSPDDPAYGRSPFDAIKISVQDNQLWFLKEDASPWDFTLEVPSEIVAQAKPKYRHRKSSDPQAPRPKPPKSKKNVENP